MSQKFKELYQNWYNKNSVLVYCTFENDPDWKKLEEWSLQNKKEVVLLLKILNDYNEKTEKSNGKVSQTEND